MSKCHIVGNHVSRIKFGFSHPSDHHYDTDTQKNNFTCTNIMLQVFKNKVRLVSECLQRKMDFLRDYKAM